MKNQIISIREFMSSEYKIEKKKRKKDLSRIAKRVGISTVLPLAFSKPSLATTVDAVPVGATQYIGEKSLEILAHALDPLVELMVALAFPVCSVIIVGSCFFFMLGKSERAWSGIQNAGLGYVLIQILPLLLNVLKAVGDAI
ncbi:hypothetical protein [Heyndrickxia oleronia]|uniref:hypothetical protein n=1 Tax=Heyndrickxia oleronia TaxID=38875 RepID=UPI003F846EDC